MKESFFHFAKIVCAQFIAIITAIKFTIIDVGVFRPKVLLQTLRSFRTSRSIRMRVKRKLACQA